MHDHEMRSFIGYRLNYRASVYGINPMFIPPLLIFFVIHWWVLQIVLAFFCVFLVALDVAGVSMASFYREVKRKLKRSDVVLCRSPRHCERSDQNKKEVVCN